ncbi:MAG: hypothetical protein LBN28_02735 [Desulfovibrio sp.]|jgi:hypothetical protein|nr:hypothetical protein [Desulfovibrio sp.]
MNRPREVLTGSLSIALLAAAFCIWSIFGNDINFCVTTGCSLYQDFTLNGISLWLVGTGVFAVLALLSLVGAASLGRAVAGIALTGDICLLLLMALTAPCVSCLITALFFAASYMSFRHAEKRVVSISNPRRRRSLLLWVWALLFTINISAVVRAQIGIWPIIPADDEVTTRLFFSPACSSCQEAVTMLSGHVDVAFYPIGENDADIYKIAQMRELLDTGMNLAEALARSQEVQAPHGFPSFSPDMLRLRFRMLRNKAHIFSAGAQSVPFFEYQGMPAALLMQKKQTGTLTPRGRGQDNLSRDGSDETLPLDSSSKERCGANTPCP